MNNKTHLITTFQISRSLHDQMKLMCLLCHISMGEFIRSAIRDKIKTIKVSPCQSTPVSGD